MSHLGPSLRRARRRPSAGRRLLVAIVLSVAANLLLLSTLDLSWLAQGEAARRDVSLAALTARDWEANRAVLPPGARSAPPAPALRPEPEPPPPPVGMKQVVDIGGPDDSAAAPDSANYFAQRNSKVEKETRSRYTGLFPGTAPVPVAIPRSSAKGSPDARPDPSSGRRQQEKRPEVALHLPSVGNLQIQRPEDAKQGDERGDSALAPAPGAAGQLGRPDGDGRTAKIDLQPRTALLEQMAGGPAPDRLADVEEGEGTFLNTQRWKFAGFFNRMSRQVQPKWNEEWESAIVARDPTGQRFLYKDRTTVLAVRMNTRGEVLQVTIALSSGVDFLDQAAKHALEKTGPYINPPPGLFDQRGEVVFGAGFTIDGLNSPRMRFSLGH